MLGNACFEKESRIKLLTNEVERIREDLQNYSLSWDSRSPTFRRVPYSMRRVHSTTLSDTYEFDCPIRQSPSLSNSYACRLSQTDSASNGMRAGTDSVLSTPTTTVNGSNRPKRRHIVHQMSEIEAYRKGKRNCIDLNVHDCSFNSWNSFAK